LDEAGSGVTAGSKARHSIPVHAPNASRRLGSRAESGRIAPLIVVFLGQYRSVCMSAFEELLERVRAGDEAAAAEMFETYRPAVKRVVAAIMRVESITHVADPSDIYQSVMASFFIRAALGQYDISGPAQLTALLTRIAKNKVADLARRPERRTSVVPVAAPGLAGIELPDPTKGPASHVMWKDLLEEVRKRFTDDERKVSDLRTQGLKWDEVAAQLGDKADTAKKRLYRAVERIARELNLEGLTDD
jgi:RNA polymerase sigma factor (sigma-70 family)